MKGGEPNAPPPDAWDEPSGADFEGPGIARQIWYSALGWSGNFGYLLLALLILGGLAGGLGYVRLMHGDFSVKFLANSFEQGIEAELGKSVEIDDVIVALAEGGGVEFRLVNLRITEPDGDIVASAPVAAVGLSSAALWNGRLMPERVELITPKLLLFYSKDTGLAMSFEATPAAGDQPLGEGAGKLQGQPERPAAPAAAIPDAAASGAQRIDVTKALADAALKARRQMEASSYLRKIGVREATVVLVHDQRMAEWRVPAASIDLEHGQGVSNVSGEATIASERGPWRISLKTDDRQGDRVLNLKVSVNNLVPRSLAAALPQLGILSPLDMPVAGDTTIELSYDGMVQGAALSLNLEPGPLRLSAFGEAPLNVEGGQFNAYYDGRKNEFELKPTPIRWLGGRATFAGRMQPITTSAGAAVWRYGLAASEGEFAAPDLGVAAVPIDVWSTEGTFIPDRGEVRVDSFRLVAGGAELNAHGETVAGHQGIRTRFEAKLGTVQTATLKALWPKTLAPHARAWVGANLSAGQITSGTFKFEKSTEPEEERSASDRSSLALEAEGLAFVLHKDLPPATAPRALLRIENDVLEINLPEAAIAVSAGKPVSLKAVRIGVAGIRDPVPAAELALHLDAPLTAVTEAMARAKYPLLERTGLQPGAIDGMIAGDLKVNVPLMTPFDPGAAKFNGNLRISDGRIKQAVGPYDIQGAAIDVQFDEARVTAKGEAIVAGVLAQLSWQYELEANAERQPPLRIVARLDNADRTQMSLDVNDLVQGEVAVEVLIEKGAGELPSIRLKADLSAAELTLAQVAWRKPAGKRATLECEVVPRPDKSIELQNFRLVGDQVAIEGWIAMGPDYRVREIYFPDFSLNVVSRLELQGKLGPNNVWKMKARGATFDGRDYFRSLFSFGGTQGEAVKPLRPSAGVDLEVEIENVIGFAETSIRKLRLSLSERGDRLTYVDMRATLDGGKPLAAELRDIDGQPRRLRADAADAGLAFRAIGFYPNLQNGRARLEVNLDGSGAAERTGTLWVENFRILGDAVVAEVFSGADDSRPAINGPGTVNRKVVREVFEFERMRVPFSIGYGQLVMEDSYLNGPLLGATIRGKVDYNTQTVSLGGTYVPLQGLNNALGGIPILGQLLSGPRGEGIFGITFAVNGSMANPQVIVNPLSVVAPGIFREIFQMTAPNPKVQPRQERQPAQPAARRVRASSQPADQRAEDDTQSSGGAMIEGWSSQTTRAKERAKN